MSDQLRLAEMTDEQLQSFYDTRSETLEKVRLAHEAAEREVITIESEMTARGLLEDEIIEVIFQ